MTRQPLALFEWNSSRNRKSRTNDHLEATQMGASTSDVRQPARLVQSTLNVIVVRPNATPSGAEDPMQKRCRETDADSLLHAEPPAKKSRVAVIIEVQRPKQLEPPADLSLRPQRARTRVRNITRVADSEDERESVSSTSVFELDSENNDDEDEPSVYSATKSSSDAEEQEHQLSNGDDTIQSDWSGVRSTSRWESTKAISESVARRPKVMKGSSAKVVLSSHNGGKGGKTATHNAVDETTKDRVMPISSQEAFDLSLPPISNIDDIFRDMTKRALTLGLDGILPKGQTARLKVGTLCSGTESPLLALEALCGSLLEEEDLRLQVDHCFSAEIDPNVQAYIQRNFQPPIIFRDIAEFNDPDTWTSDPHASTAFGGKAPIPGDLDLLIAGVVCKDFSRLNRWRKGLGEGGESTVTFEGMFNYCKHRSPKVVIIENVNSADWDGMMNEMRRLRYTCTTAKVDTKKYYLPQTRNRVYMICVSIDGQGLCGRKAVDKWVDLVHSFERPASSPISDFLIGPNESYFEQTLLDHERQLKSSVRLQHIKWVDCWERHVRYRRDTAIGDARPIFEWQRGGSATAPEWLNRDWVKSQPERVWDFLEVCDLRNALDTRGCYDMRYKLRVIDVSQNINYAGGIDTVRHGVSGCLTCSGIFFLPSLGRPMSGLEALALQGLPVRKLLFTHETHDVLQRLAGNAMSSPVVFAAIASAIIACGKGLLTAANPTTPSPSTSLRTVPAPKMRAGPLKTRTIKIGELAEFSLQELLHDARISSIKCSCETQLRSSQASISNCTRCSHTVCSKCQDDRTHHYTSTTATVLRMSASAFVAKWERCFRTSLNICVDESFQHEVFKTPALRKCKDAEMSQRLKGSFDKPLTFRKLVRGRFWIALFESSEAKLVVDLTETPHAHLFIKPTPMIAVNSPVRKVLSDPIARTALIHLNRLTDASWSFRDAARELVSITVQSVADAVPSYRARLGLPNYTKETMAEILCVKVSPQTVKRMHGLDVSGTYTLKERCGVALNILYERTSGETPSMFFYLEVDPIGSAKEDCFVFGGDPYPTNAELLLDRYLQLPATWRPWTSSSQSELQALPLMTWDENPRALPVMSPILEKLSVRSVSGDEEERLQQLLMASCAEPVMILSCRLPSSSSKASSTSAVIDLQDERFWSSHSYHLHTIRELVGIPSRWNTLAASDLYHICSRCVPPTVAIQWIQSTRKNGNTKLALVSPREDAKEASDFERIYHRRPQVFTVVKHPQNDSQIELQFGLNLKTLAHRAIASLDHLQGTASVSYRLQSGFVDQPSVRMPDFSLQDNKANEEFAGLLQLASGCRLRTDQSRSLSWMLEREAIETQGFEIEEIEEGVLEPMQWRVEVKASKEIRVRGGILADEAGYGKTLLILSLAHKEIIAKTTEPNPMASDTGHIYCPATLLILPPSLVLQWSEELTRFLGTQHYNNKSVLVITSYAQLKKMTIDNFRNAKFVLINWNMLWKPGGYLDAMASFAALGQPKGARGRSFDQWMCRTAQRIASHVPLLRKVGIAGLREALKKRGTTLFDNRSQSADIMDDTEEASAFEPHKSWTKHEPLLQMFRFNRVVVDEISYVNDALISAVRYLTADKRWILSGTPALDDFADVASMAALLGVRLGLAIPPAGISGQRYKALTEEMTGPEKFLTALQKRTNAWHKARFDYAQRFLDHFVRQNSADTAGIEQESTIQPAPLDSTHYRTYKELQDHFENTMMDFRKPNDDTITGKRIIAAMDGFQLLKTPLPEHVLARSAIYNIATWDNPDCKLSAKFERMIVYISTIPENEKAVVFAPGLEVCEAVVVALRRAQISHTVVHGKNPNAGKDLKQFKESNAKRVRALVLDLADVTAAGQNLQCANHGIFLGPLIENRQTGFEAKLEQARKRMLRPYQKRKVNFLFLFAPDTVDVDIMQHRMRLSAPLQESARPSLGVSDVREFREMDSKREATKLLKDGNNRFCLVPLSMVDHPSFKGLKAKEDFTTLSRFSAFYDHDA